MQKRDGVRILLALLLGLSVLLVNCGGGGDGGSKKPPGPNPLDTWHQRTTNAYVGSEYRIAYGNGMFVMGSVDNFLTSTDGISWTIRSAGADCFIRDLTYGNDMFVAVGQEFISGIYTDKYFILRSSDGITWTVATTFEESNHINAIAYGNGIFVIMGENGTIMTSHEGVSWTKVTTGFSYDLKRVVHGNGTFITIGYPNTDSIDSVILRSTDGITWENTKSLKDISLRDITYGNGVFVAVGSSGTILTSPDGVQWTRRNEDARYVFRSVAYGGGSFLLMGGEPPSDLYPFPPPYVTPAISGSSEDAVNWTFTVHPDLSGSSTYGDFSQITYGNGIFLTQGLGQGSALWAIYHAIFISTDGISWTSLYLRGGAWDISYGKGLFVGGLITSPDGMTWTMVGQNNWYGPLRVIYADENFVGVGGSSVFSSPDGKSWSAVYDTTGPVRYLNDIIYGNGIYVAVGENGTILTSRDRISWTERVSGTTNGLLTVTYGNGTFIVCIRDLAEVLVSKDGINWTKSKTEIGSEAFLVEAGSYGHGLFVLVGGNGAIITSPDGLHWTKRDSGVPEQSITSIAFGDGTFVAIGVYGTIVSSTNGKSWTVRNLGISFGHPNIDFGNHTFLIMDTAGMYGKILQSEQL